MAPDVAAGVTVHMTRNPVGVITSVDDTIVELLGWRPDQVVGELSTKFVHPEDHATAIAAWLEMVTSPGLTRVWRGRYQTSAGAWKWVETVNRFEESDDPVVYTSMNHVTVEQATVEEELRAREQLLSRLSDALPVGLVQIDVSGHVTFTNDQLHAIVGVPPAATIEAQLAAVVVEDRSLLETAIAAVLSDQPVDDIEIRLLLAVADAPTAPDAHRVCMLSLRALTDGDGIVSGAVGCLSDVTYRVLLRRELEVRASVDKLTSCLNRAATLELLERTMVTPDETCKGNAVIFIDLDRFKSVNDRFGHAAGDSVLMATADRLRAAVRGCDQIGRMGGDEFLVVCPGVDSSALAVTIAERIATAMTTTVDLGRGPVELRASVGVAWTAEALHPDTFIAQADSAMYESKRTGCDGVTLFTPTCQPATI
ncbi:MAG: hypothetical protein QOH64_1879 [Acidimicrobiaceae bacterium]